MMHRAVSRKSLVTKNLPKELAGRGYQLSSANSINIGRLVPQVVYYVYAYAKLLENGEIENGEKINVTVPTGNFGNILAAYFAKQMGVPIDKLICASNDNKVLYDFFKTGVYDKNRPFILTSSPSMDILISSNLERLIYPLHRLRCGGDQETHGRAFERWQIFGYRTRCVRAWQILSAVMLIRRQMQRDQASL